MTLMTPHLVFFYTTKKFVLKFVIIPLLCFFYIVLHIYRPNGSAETGKKSYSELQTFLKICS